MRIGIIGAMDVEVALLKEQLKDPQVMTCAGMEFCAGGIGGAEVVVVQSGIGKVNAGICTQVLVDRFEVQAVINTGVAGSLDEGLDVGDLVVSTDCGWHDYDVTPLGYAPGQVPGLSVLTFPADEALRACACASAAEVAPEVSVREGRVVSGDQFIASQDAKERLASQFGGMCCEMEGAAIAQTAWLNGVPFVVVRAISDKAGAEGQVTDYATFESAAAHRCAKIVLRMLERGLR